MKIPILSPEFAVCGGILHTPRNIKTSCRILAPERFLDARARAVFTAMLTIDARGQRPHELRVRRELRRNGPIPRVISDEEFNDCGRWPFGTDHEFYCRKLLARDAREYLRRLSSGNTPDHLVIAEADTVIRAVLALGRQA